LLGGHDRGVYQGPGNPCLACEFHKARGKQSPTIFKKVYLPLHPQIGGVERQEDGGGDARVTDGFKLPLGNASGDGVIDDPLRDADLVRDPRPPSLTSTLGESMNSGIEVMSAALLRCISMASAVSANSMTPPGVEVSSMAADLRASKRSKEPAWQRPVVRSSMMVCLG